MINEKGRPEKYTDEQLNEILIQFAINNTGKINFLQLEKETGIKRHVWSRRMKNQIDQLNKRELNVESDNFERIPLPNVVDIIDKHWGNKQQMINAFLSYNNYIQSLWDRAILQEKAKEREKRLIGQIEELNKEIAYLRENRDFYKNEYEKIAVESTYDHKRKEKGINNVISIEDKKKISSSNWKENFPDLF